MDDAKSVNTQIIENPNELKFDVLKIDSSLKKEEVYTEGESKFQYCKEYNEEKGEQDKIFIF